MNILFRILVVLALAVNAVCLWFAQELEAKRDMLMQGNESLRGYIEEIAPQVEDSAAYEKEQEPAYEGYKGLDDSGTDAEDADMDPEFKDILKDYEYAYEVPVAETMSVDVEKLKEVYCLDENKQLDLSSGKPKTKGAPLEEEMKPLVKAVGDQRDRLIKTRTALKKMRELLLEVVATHNEQKAELRVRAKTIVERDKTIEDRDGQIATLEGEKRNLEGEISSLKTDIESLNAEKESLENDLTAKEEELLVANDEIARLKKRIEEIVESLNAGGGKGGTTMNQMTNVSAGVKGEVIRVNNDYGFCIVKLTDRAFIELVGEDGSKPLPNAQFYVKSKGLDASKDNYKATVELTGITKEPNVVTCKIVGDYTLEDVSVGDELYLTE